MKHGSRYFYVALGAAVFFVLLFHNVHYTANEGFNPTDEGAVIAQSYRLLHGEIPHRDFISIRPVFSAVLHTVHFYSPLPLISSGRWFALIEYFIYSFLWMFILLRNGTLNAARKPGWLLFLCGGIFCFLLNMNTYNLYPWTTIDALFFSVLSFAFFSAAFNSGIKGTRLAIRLAVSLFLMALAALCRQSFILPLVLLAFTTFILLLRRRRFLALFPVLFIGVIPFLSYFVLLADTGAWESFKEQMAGRTELFDTGVLRYIKSFLKARLLPLNFILIAVYFILTLMKRSSIRGLPSSLRRQLNGRRRGMWQLFISIYAIAFVMCTFLLFAFKDYKTIPFEFFWMLVSLLVPALYLRLLDTPTKLTLFFALMIAWTSSISLGDNFPVFATGILATGVGYLIYTIVTGLGLIAFPSAALTNKLEAFAKFAWRIRLREGLIVISIALLMAVAINGQRNFNYRDRASCYLTQDMGTLFPAFGGIKTNAVTFDYFRELKQLLDSLPQMHNHFAMLPNNPVIYAVTDSRNPLPLDWVQGNEYVGAKPQFFARLNEIVEHDTVYFIADKFESKNMAYALIPMTWQDDVYGYMGVIRQHTRKVGETRYFEILKSGH